MSLKFPVREGKLPHPCPQHWQVVISQVNGKLGSWMSWEGWRLKAPYRNIIFTFLPQHPGITKNSFPPATCEIFIQFHADEVQLSVMKDVGGLRICRMSGQLPVSAQAGSHRTEGKGGKGRRRKPLLTYLVSPTNCAAKQRRGNFRKTGQASKKSNRISWSLRVVDSSREEQKVSTDLVNLITHTD